MNAGSEDPAYIPPEGGSHKSGIVGRVFRPDDASAYAALRFATRFARRDL